MENHKSQSFLVLMGKKRGFYFFRPNADAVSAIAVRNDSKKGQVKETPTCGSRTVILRNSIAVVAGRLRKCRHQRQSLPNDRAAARR